MPKFRFLFATLLALPHLVFAAPETRVYQGSIGDAPIVMELVLNHGQGQGRYFYKRDRRSIRLLVSTAPDKTMTLCATGDDASDGEDCAPFSLHAQGKGWRGEWVDEQGRQVPVVLTPLQAAELGRSGGPNDPPATGSLYQRALLDGLGLRLGKSESVQGRELRWWIEPITNVSLFRLTGGYPPGALSRLNAQLARRQWQEVATALDCLAGRTGNEYNVRTTPRLLGDRLVSVSLLADFYCGGAHPDFADTPLNLDVRTGKELRLEDLLWVGRGTPYLVTKVGEPAAKASYRQQTLAPWLAGTMESLYPDRIVGYDGCEYDTPDVWRDPTWYLTPAGLYLGPTFARVARACELPDWPILPWSVVNKHRGRLRLKLP